MRLDRNRLELFMIRNGLNYKGLAERLGCTPQNVSHILSKGTCSTVTAGKLAAALNIDPAELLADDFNERR